MIITTKILGNGSFGKVFPGVDEGIKVAVKKIEVSSINSDNLRRECKEHLQFNQENVVKRQHT